jgi:hypothetical protein
LAQREIAPPTCTVHITDEQVPGPCTFVENRNSNEVILVLQRQSLLYDPIGTARALEDFWNGCAQARYDRINESLLRSTA